MVKPSMVTVQFGQDCELSFNVPLWYMALEGEPVFSAKLTQNIRNADVRT